MSGRALADAALSLVGTPFRLYGRDPRSGLDCVGVLAAAMKAVGGEAHLPNGYTLRSRIDPDADRIAARLGMVAADGALHPGDVLLLRLSPCQLHLALAASSDAIVHAHAGLRKVVTGPLPREWARVGHWRVAGASTTLPR